MNSLYDIIRIATPFGVEQIYNLAIFFGGHFAKSEQFSYKLKICYSLTSPDCSGILFSSLFAKKIQRKAGKAPENSKF
ncbi:MAG: hypothetical protein HY062_16535 [Bacteroidetes bacterium]|nr:hypothetical protein [Bacteroidota bacterium]